MADQHETNSAKDTDAGNGFSALKDMVIGGNPSKEDGKLEGGILLKLPILSVQQAIDKLSTSKLPSIEFNDTETGNTIKAAGWCYLGSTIVQGENNVIIMLTNNSDGQQSITLPRGYTQEQLKNAIEKKERELSRTLVINTMDGDGKILKKSFDPLAGIDDLIAKARKLSGGKAKLPLQSINTLPSAQLASARLPIEKALLKSVPISSLENAIKELTRLGTSSYRFNDPNAAREVSQVKDVTYANSQVAKTKEGGIIVFVNFTINLEGHSKDKSTLHAELNPKDASQEGVIIKAVEHKKESALAA